MKKTAAGKAHFLAAAVHEADVLAERAAKSVWFAKEAGDRFADSEGEQTDLATEVQIASTPLTAPMSASSVATAAEHVASERASTSSTTGVKRQDAVCSLSGSETKAIPW